MNLKNILKTTLFSLGIVGLGVFNTSSVNALEILATNYSMNATQSKMTAQELCETAGLVTTDPEAGVTWACSSANLDTTQAGKYSINIRATDGSDSVVKTIQVKVKANTTNTAPVLELTKTSETIYKGDSIDLNSYVKTATDAEDGNLTPVISGSVDTSKAGIYAITYTITDGQGMKASAKLNVKVIVKGVESDESAPIVIDNNQNEQTSAEDTNQKVEEGKELPQTADATATTLTLGLIGSSVLGTIILRKKRELVD